MLGAGPLLGQALQNSWDRRALGTCPSKCLGQARSTGPLLGQALQNSWDKPSLGTGPSKFLGQARSWDMPFKMLGTGGVPGVPKYTPRGSQEPQNIHPAGPRSSKIYTPRVPGVPKYTPRGSQEPQNTGPALT